jgi:hypothetical protein
VDQEHSEKRDPAEYVEYSDAPAALVVPRITRHGEYKKYLDFDAFERTLRR